MNMSHSSPDFNGQFTGAAIFTENAPRYWAASLPVVPLKPYSPTGGRGGEPTGKEPANRHWEEMASRMPNEAERAAWKLYNSTGNIGLPLGPQSRLVAVDIDTDDPRVLQVIDDLLPPSPWHRIGQKGRVQLYRWEGQSTVRIKYKAKDGKLRSLVEILSTGTQIVLPPSIHPKTVRPYTANCELLDCLDRMVPLPSDTEQILREALAGLGYELDGGKASKKSITRRPDRPGIIGEGSRNDTLFREASRLRGVGHDEEEVAALLQIFNRKNCSPPLEEDEVVAIAASAMRYSPNEWYELNDSGNALRFARDHAGCVRYVEDLGIWRTWTGTHWQDDAAGLAVMRLASETVERMKAEVETTTSADAAKALRRHARASGDRARLRAMTDVAASLPGMSALSTDFDDLPGFIVASNGVIDLANGALLPHDPARLTTKCLPTAYQPNAEAPRFKAFLERVQPDPEVRIYLQRYLGQALHGQRAEQVMGWWHGRGRNGKSVLADTLLGLLPGYAIECPATTFLTDDKRAPNAPRPDLLRLQGARLVIGSEAADGRRLDSVLLKRLTGDASLTVRGLYKAETTFPITFNMVVLTNPWPRADESDDALWARNVRTPFLVQIPSAEQVKKLHELLLSEEAEGILAWLVQGAVDYTSHGLTTPSVLTAATVTWRRRIGTIERFMRICTRPAPGGEMGLTDLHIRYVKAVQQTYGNPVGIENFRSRLEGLGYIITDDEYGETVRGVQLAPITSVWAAEAMKKVAA